MMLAELRAHDPNGGRGTTGGKHYLCPLPACAAYMNPRKHRSFSVNESTGVYLCHRCNAKGILGDFADRQPCSSRREIARAQLGRFFGSTQRKQREQPEQITNRDNARTLRAPAREDVQAAAKATVPLAGSPGAAYLASRGLAGPPAQGVRFARSWLAGGPAVVFAGIDLSSAVVALQGRYTAANAAPKTKSLGPIGTGVFATPGALDAQLVVICEAPIDALSLADVGFPAVALFGKGATAQLALLRKRFALRSVVLATDSDEAGESAAAALRTALQLGTRCFRLAYPDGIKDANAWLLADRGGLRAAVAAIVAQAQGHAVQLAIEGDVEDADDLLGYARDLGL